MSWKGLPEVLGGLDLILAFSRPPFGVAKNHDRSSASLVSLGQVSENWYWILMVCGPSVLVTRESEAIYKLAKGFTLFPSLLIGS